MSVIENFRGKVAASFVTATLLCLLAGCGGGGGGSGGNPPAPPPPPPPPPPVTAQVEVTVIDNFGRFLSGAAITNGATSATTGNNGRATIAINTGSEQVLALRKDGFAEQFKVVNLATGTTSGSLQAMLIEREDPQAIANIEAGGIATGKHGVKVTFPADALVTSAGARVTGSVDMFMTPVDVSSVDVGAFPGIFAGTSGGGPRGALVSFGTAELVPMQGGAKLALAPGKSAEIELPLYANELQDGTPIAVGASIPLWALATNTGVWQQEGTGTVVASADSPTGLALRATITHFSWWNCDAFAETGTVTITVQAPGGVTLPANTVVNLTGTLIGGGPDATADTTVGVGVPTTLEVPSGLTTRIDAHVQQGQQTCGGFVNASPPSDGNQAVTITLACVTLPTPRIVDPPGPTSTNSQSDLPFHIIVDGPVPDTVELLVDGAPVATFTPQFFYRGFWDSSAFAEGQHTLTPRVTLQGVSGTGEPVTVVIDRTPPEITAFAPASTADVDIDTDFVIDFNETVTAAPRNVRDAVRLTVVPIGETTPVEIPFTAALDAVGRRLTVQPSAALPLGTAGVSWGGLHDAAGNAVTGTVAATWNVSRSARLGPDLELASGSTLAMTTDSAGGVYVVRHLAPSGDLQGLRLDGTEFVPLGQAINERPPAPDSSSANERVSIAAGANGTLFAALQQQNAAGDSSEILVRRFNTVSGNWETLDVALPVGNNFAASPQIAVDSSNRPVVSFIASSIFVLQAHRFENGAWVSLGNIDGPVFTKHSLAIRADGTPTAAYLRGAFGSNASVLVAAQHNGTAWQSLGSVIDSSPTGALGRPTIAFAPDALPWVAWSRINDVRLVRFDGTAFVEVPIDPVLATFNGQSSFAFLNGDPVVIGSDVFLSGRIDLRRLRNGAWEPPVILRAAGLTGTVWLAAGADSAVIAETVTSGIGRVSRVLFP
jgi:hypothetical protein